MKKFIKIMIFIFFLYVLIGACVFLLYNTVTNARAAERGTVMNRITESYVSAASEASSLHGQELLDSVFSSFDTSCYSSGAIPTSASFVSFASIGLSEVGRLNSNSESQYVWAASTGNSDEGFIIFDYAGIKGIKLLLISEGAVLIGFLITFFVMLYIEREVLKPFADFREYPEMLSRNEITENIPESKSRYFGRYIWGMNMLNDRLKNDRKRITEMSGDKQALLTTIAHGIKTPVANIKLYADAISTGLYQPDGIPNESDSAVAAKINKNADEIHALVKEMIENASSGLVDFTPSITTFYAEELISVVTSKYSTRFDVLRIPFTAECRNNMLLKSDREGITRILSQLIENAIKYGDGTGISLLIEKASDGMNFVVTNRGSFIPAGEIPYVFNSFWRGASSEGVEGSGVGLFEANHIARKLYGNMRVKSTPASEGAAAETSFTLWLPISSEG